MMTKDAYSFLALFPLLLLIPERFIDENGQLKKCEEFIPFPLGKRNCIGEGLARAELFLFAANFFKKFYVLPVDSLKMPSIEKKVYFSAMPMPFECALLVANQPMKYNRGTAAAD